MRNAKSFVYLLAHDTEPILKIGRSVDPVSRANALREAIDLAASFQIECLADQASQVEKMLHFVVGTFRVRRPRGDGYTEWFETSALSKIQMFLEINELGLSLSPLSAGGISPSRIKRNISEKQSLLSTVERPLSTLLDDIERFLEFCSVTPADIVGCQCDAEIRLRSSLLSTTLSRAAIITSGHLAARGLPKFAYDVSSEGECLTVRLNPSFFNFRWTEHEARIIALADKRAALAPDHSS